MLALVAALGCIVVNAFFVAAEFALAKVRPTALEALAQRGDGLAVRAHAITRELDAYLSATQLGVTLASLGLGWLGEPAMVELLAPLLRASGAGEATAHRLAVGIGFAVLSALHIVVGELVPKSFAIARPEDVARRSAWVLRAFYLVTFPALWLLNGASRLALRLFGLPWASEAEDRLSVDELRLVLHHGVHDDDVTRRTILERVLRASDREVRTIMVPRSRMQVLSLADGRERWGATIRRYAFSRYPVSADGRPDRIVGYVCVKDLVLGGTPASPATITQLRRDVLAVPPSRKVSQVLAEMQRTSIPIALVVDARRLTVGMVVLGDVLRTLVGEMRDEHHTPRPMPAGGAGASSIEPSQVRLREGR